MICNEKNENLKNQVIFGKIREILCKFMINKQKQKKASYEVKKLYNLSFKLVFGNIEMDVKERW